MFSSHLAGTWHSWHLITRLGEAQLLVPLALFIALVVGLSPAARTDAVRWIALLGAAALVTASTKVAFIGWGIGSASLNFTGISGHAMFAAAVYPPLFSALASGRSARTRRWAVAAGCAVAFLVGVSRVILWTHSTSEIVAGWLAGGLVSVAVLARPISLPVQLNLAMLGAVALWLTFIPAAAPAFDTHSVITRLALKVSGHERPYTRRALLRAHARSGLGQCPGCPNPTS